MNPIVTLPSSPYVNITQESCYRRRTLTNIPTDGRDCQNLLSCLFLLTILLGKIHGETIANVKSAITTKNGHHAATSIIWFLKAQK